MGSAEFQGPGATAVVYDTLRSPAAADFGNPATCLEWDRPETESSDTEVPVTKVVFFYVIRVENDCPGVAGTIGAGSDGQPRSGRACP